MDKNNGFLSNKKVRSCAPDFSESVYFNDEVNLFYSKQNTQAFVYT